MIMLYNLYYNNEDSVNDIINKIRITKTECDKLPSILNAHFYDLNFIFNHDIFKHKYTLIKYNVKGDNQIMSYKQFKNDIIRNHIQAAVFLLKNGDKYVGYNTESKTFFESDTSYEYVITTYDRFKDTIEGRHN